MQNQTALATIPLGNLSAVTGGQHDHDPPSPIPTPNNAPPRCSPLPKPAPHPAPGPAPAPPKSFLRPIWPQPVPPIPLHGYY